MSNGTPTLDQTPQQVAPPEATPQNPTNPPGFVPAAIQPEKKPAAMTATPGASATSAKPADPSHPPGFIPSETANAPPPGETPPPEEGNFSKVWHWLNNSVVSKKTVERGMGFAIPGGNQNTVPTILEQGPKVTEALIGQGNHPIAAALSKAVTGVVGDEAEMIHQTLTPLSLGLAALTAGESLVNAPLASIGYAGEASSAVAKATELPNMIRIPWRAVQAAASTYFGGTGAMSALLERQPGEDISDYTQRVLGGGAQALMGAAGDVAIAKDALHSFLRNRLGMSDGLASKVVDNVKAMNDARSEAAKKTSQIRDEAAQRQRGIDSKRTTAVNAIQIDLENNLNALEGHRAARITNINQDLDSQTKQLQQHLGKLDKQKVEVGKQIIVDTAHTLANEEVRLGNEFNSIGDEIKAPVTDSTTVRGIVQEEFNKYNIKEPVPGAATAALGKQVESEIDPRLPQVEPPSERLVKKGLSDERGFIGEPPPTPDSAGNAVDFNTLTRVKNDLWDTARRMKMKDPLISKALGDAAVKVSDLQEAAAEKADKSGKLVDRYRKAKTDYMQMKRGIGSQEVTKWLNAERQGRQVMAKQVGDRIFGKVGTFERGTNAAILRTILDSVGIDTSSFDAIVDERKTTKSELSKLPGEARKQLSATETATSERAAYEKSQTKEPLKDASRQASEEKKALGSEIGSRIGEVESEADAKVKKAEAEGEIVPGKKTSELTGRTNEQLLRDRLDSFGDKGASMGAPHLMRMMMAMYGIASVLRGRFLAGATMLGYGMGREAIPMLVKDPGFQDWIIKQSGVEPSNKLMIRKLRSGIEATYPLLREMAKSGTGAVALGDKTDSLDTPPVAPGDAPGQVPMDLTPPPQ